MSDLGPQGIFPGIVDRKPHLIDLMLRARPGTSQFRLWGARTVNDAYGNYTGAGNNSNVGGSGGVNLLTVDADSSFRSLQLERRNVMLIGSQRGLTRILLDLDDFFVNADPPTVPEDGEVLFCRIQENRVAAGGFLAVAAGAAQNGDEPIKGPILVIPPAPWWTMRDPALTIQGLAPSNTGCTVGFPPLFDETTGILQRPSPMHIVLPRPTSSVTIRNEDGANALFYSYGPGQPMSQVAAGSDFTSFGSAREILVASSQANAAVAFSIDAVINLGVG